MTIRWFISSRARALAGVGVAVALASTVPSCSLGRREAPEDAPTVEKMAERLGADVVEHVRRGYLPGRSPEITMIPEPWNVVVRWNGRTLGTPETDPRSTHPTPWDYHQRVPIILYGPGFVRGGMASDVPTDVSAIAPTVAELLRLPFSRGEALDEAIFPREERAGTPRAIVVVAHDGGGLNVMEQWPDAWPEQRGLITRGAAFTNATIGSAPAVTAAIHANMGTGTYPRDHGLPENVARLPNGEIGEIYFDRGDPQLLEAETVADAWDRAGGNRPWVGLLAYESWHLGMMSRGSLAPGGDRDVAVLWEPQEGHFWANEDFYSLPDYLPGDQVLGRYLRLIDQEDGALDGRWMGHDLEDPAIVPGTPAFVRYQADALMEMIDREPIGEDDLTDLLFVELKPLDFGGHIWNMVAPEEERVLRAQDDLVGELVRKLDEKVGEGRYVLIVTADHGQTPVPEERGGVRIDPDVVGRRVVEYFRQPIVERTTPSGIYLNTRVAAEQGILLDDVARFVATLTYSDVLPSGADPDEIPEADRDRPVFAGVLTGGYLEELGEDQIRALGPGDFPEGNLTGLEHPYVDVLGGSG